MWELLSLAILAVLTWFVLNTLGKRDPTATTQGQKPGRVLNQCEKASYAYFALGSPGKDRVQTDCFEGVPNWIYEDSEMAILDVDHSAIWPVPWDGDDIIRGERVVLACVKASRPMVTSFAFPLRAHFPFVDKGENSLGKLTRRADSSSTMLIYAGESWTPRIDSLFAQAVTAESERPVATAKSRLTAFQEIDVGLRYSRLMR